MYKEDLALNNLQVLICHKTIKPNQIKHVSIRSKGWGCTLEVNKFELP